MTNPILVFVDASVLKVDACKFPIGFTSDGRKICNTTCANGKNVLVLVNDDEQLPECPPFEANKSMPLLMVAHSGSQEFGDPMNAIRKAWGWCGTVDVCMRFSHVPTDAVYKEICSIWKTPGQAQAFADKCRSVDSLAALDGLAVLCQLKKLNPCQEVGTLPAEYGSRLNSDLPEKFTEKFDDGEWDCALNLVKCEAERLVGGGN